jgi:hypothetical protein
VTLSALAWQPTENWTLVSAGPSRAHLRPEHFLDGPIVTVNRAIDIVERGLHVDFAAFADGPGGENVPGGCWTSCNLERFWSPGMQLWVTLRPVEMKARAKDSTEDMVVPGPPMALMWDMKLPASIGLRFMPIGNVQDSENPKVYRHAFTTLCALMRIRQFKPKRVRILCADMAGAWHPGMSEEECHKHDFDKNGLHRWMHERKALEAEIKRMRKDGVEVDQVTPEPLDHSQGAGPPSPASTTDDTPTTPRPVSPLAASI